MSKFPLKNLPEFERRLSHLQAEHAERVRLLRFEFRDTEKIFQDFRLLRAIEGYAEQAFPIKEVFNLRKIIDLNSKDPLDGWLAIGGGAFESFIYRPGLYHSVDTTHYYGGSGRVETRQVVEAEWLSLHLDQGDARERFLAELETLPEFSV